MKNLTKKEIRENTRTKKRSGFAPAYTHHYDVDKKSFSKDFNGMVLVQSCDGSICLDYVNTKEEFINVVYDYINDL